MIINTVLLALVLMLPLNIRHLLPLLSTENETGIHKATETESRRDIYKLKWLFRGNNSAWLLKKPLGGGSRGKQWRKASLVRLRDRDRAIPRMEGFLGNQVFSYRRRHKI